MFESVFKYIYRHYLSNLIDIDEESVYIGLWSGLVELHNINLKDDLIKKFRIPISIHSGMLYYIYYNIVT